MTPKLVPSLPFPPEAPVQRPHAESTAGSSHAAAAVMIYAAAFITGAIVMSFEMLGSRYLNPHFGSGIYTWAALISTVLFALAAGYFLGGTLADRTASLAVLALTVIVGSLYLLALPSFAQAILEFVLAGVDDIRAGSLIAALAATSRPGIGRRLRHLDRRRDRRHAGHHLLPHSDDRLARHHAHARGARIGRGFGAAGAG